MRSPSQADKPITPPPTLPLSPLQPRSRSELTRGVGGEEGRFCRWLFFVPIFPLPHIHLQLSLSSNCSILKATALPLRRSLYYSTHTYFGFPTNKTPQAATGEEPGLARTMGTRQRCTIPASSPSLAARARVCVTPHVMARRSSLRSRRF